MLYALRLPEITIRQGHVVGRDGFLTSATHSRRCTGQGIEVDSTSFGAFALRYFAGQVCRRT